MFHIDFRWMKIDADCRRRCLERSTGVDNFRAHFISFFEFLKQDELIDSPTHLALLECISPLTTLSFDESDLPDENLDPVSQARKLQVTTAFNQWCTRAAEKYGHAMQTGGVEGWFEVYRVRKSFIVLRERELRKSAIFRYFKTRTDT